MEMTITTNIFLLFPQKLMEIVPLNIYSGGFLLFLFFIQFLHLMNEYYYQQEQGNENKEKDDKSVKEVKPVIPYEHKYQTKFDDFIKKHREEPTTQLLQEDFLEHLKSCFLFENTPLGNVIMFYKYYKDQKDASTFVYYSDHNIPHRYLETISQKYCMTFHCSDIYIDVNEELKKYEEQLKEKEKEEKEEEEKKENNKENNKETKTTNVFANFKSYNKSSSSIIPLNSKTSVTKTKSSNKQHDGIKANTILPTQHQNGTNHKTLLLLKEKSNRYSYLGKLVNFSFLHTPTQKVYVKLINKNFSYKDFKTIIKTEINEIS